MTFEIMFAVLIVYVVIKEVFFYRTIDRLTSKLMSRDYHEFRISEEFKPRAPIHRVELPQEQEDLRSLNEFMR